MRLLTDENVAALRDRGHDVVAVKESLPGASDQVILERAHAEERLVVTFDKDFGELAARLEFRVPGVILLRLSGSSPEADNARATSAIASRQDWAGHFAVVTDDRIRLRPLPARQRRR